MRKPYAIIVCVALLAALPLGAAAERTLRESGLHSVEKGETLTSIAGMYGMSVKELKGLNRIRSARRLKIGSQVKVFKPSAPEPEAAAAAPAPEPEKAGPPAEESRVSMLARELKELANSSIHSPIVNEVRELSEPAAGSGVGAVRDKLTAIARKMLDIPYRFGGSSFLGIDCSGYVQKVFGLFDIVLPRTAREQFRLGQKVEREELSKGDLVFFRTYAKFPSHVGIYLGDNRFIHASSKDRKVTIDSLDTPYYYRRFIGARRLPLKETADEI